MRSIVLGTLLAFGVAQEAEPKIVKNGIGMELIEIPAGKFTMGSPSDEKGRESDEESVRVTLTRPFLLGRTEVTQGQWKQVMNSEPWKKQTVFEVDDDYPATSITFFDAVKFCDKLTELEREKRKEPASLHYRLPTEAEWEYACRAGTTTAFSFDKEADINSYAWIKRWDGPAARQPFGHKVAQKMPNSWGLHDMHGNVFEWCSDWYDKKLMGGVDPVGPPHGAYRTSRGGGWWDYPIHYRSAYRFSFVPTREFERLGFRVAGYQPAE